VPRTDFGKEDLVCNKYISYPLWGLDLCLCAHEWMNVRILNTNKE
jgi:hypothetical protein